jgi:hypothetical protein
MTFKSKKAQGMSINVLIIAALGLVVFIILASVFVSKTKKLSSDLDDCRSKLGSCISKENCQTQGGSEAPGTSCKSPEVCCVKPIT